MGFRIEIPEFTYADEFSLHGDVLLRHSQSVGLTPLLKSQYLL